MVQITFKTKQGETYSLGVSNFSYTINDYETFEISLAATMEQAIDPFILRLVSHSISEKKEKTSPSVKSLRRDHHGKPTGLEVSITYSRLENGQIAPAVIQLCNARVTSNISESVNAYSPNGNVQSNSCFSLTSNEATIYGVEFPGR
ncbi:MAG: hypothetical protein LBV72_13840 [Tannerella sp.]|jgi:hypothetical protein|nr:hypothetical protein [Tannerella sp.]